MGFRELVKWAFISVEQGNTGHMLRGTDEDRQYWG